MATEDFTTFTEVDTGADLSETATRVTFNGAIAQNDTYLYKDYGAAYFSGGFTHKIDFRLSAALKNPFNFWEIANDLGTENGLAGGSKPLLAVGIQDYNVGDNTFPFLLLQRTSTGGASFNYTTFFGQLNTTYYLKITYDPSAGSFGTITLYIYPTDADRTAGTNLIESKSRVLTVEAASYRYMYGFQSFSTTGSANTDSGYLENLEFITSETFTGSDTIALTFTKRTSPSSIRQTVVALSDTLSSYKGQFATVVSNIVMSDTVSILRGFLSNVVTTVRLTDIKLLSISISKQTVIAVSETLKHALSIAASTTVTLSEVFRTRNIWNNVVKNVSSWLGTNKNTSSWSSPNKNSSIWTSPDKHNES